MKKLLILGGGTAGSMAANKLRKTLPAADWSMTVVDADDNHRYQPGFLFMPFGTYKPDQVTKSRRKSLSKDVLAGVRRDRQGRCPTRTPCCSPTAGASTTTA